MGSTPPSGSKGPLATETKRKVVGIGAAIATMVALVLVLGAMLTREARHPTHPTATPMRSPGPPIAEEAGVFETIPSALAVAPGSRSESTRTLTSFRSLRAYPGAPPRIPHALTADEFRTTTCLVCHGRGGYAERFDAFVPLTPHAQYEACLQCHVPQQTSTSFRDTDWQTTAWPEPGQRAMEGSPWWIPHDLQMRGNCLTCHGGPGAVREIRTTHPERANCRQCHVPASTTSQPSVFTRSLDGSGREPQPEW